MPRDFYISLDGFVTCEEIEDYILENKEYFIDFLSAFNNPSKIDLNDFYKLKLIRDRVIHIGNDKNNISVEEVEKLISKLYDLLEGANV